MPRSTRAVFPDVYCFVKVVVAPNRMEVFQSRLREEHDFAELVERIREAYPVVAEEGFALSWCAGSTVLDLQDELHLTPETLEMPDINWFVYAKEEDLRFGLARKCRGCARLTHSWCDGCEATARVEGLCGTPLCTVCEEANTLCPDCRGHDGTLENPSDTESC